MKKQKRTTLRRIFSITLALSLCLSMLTALARADEASVDDPAASIEIILPSTLVKGTDDPALGEAPLDAQIQTSDEIGNESVVTDAENAINNETEGADEAEDEAVAAANAATDEDAAAAHDEAATGAAANDGDADDDPDKVSDAENENHPVGERSANTGVSGGQSHETAKVIDLEEQPDADNGPVAENKNNDEEVVYSDKGVTSDGLDWELAKDAITGKYTLTITFKNDSENDPLNITKNDLEKVEQYAAEVSAVLAEKYGVAWEWDSTAAPSGSEDVQKFQVFLTGNGNMDHTYRYDTEKLEQMDGEFTLEKVDEYGNVITDSETTFQLWHINEITDPETSETVEVKMFCSYDPETNTYTFIPTESTIQTINGRIEILYAMMKDVVYFLQEVQPPVGYELDPNIHVIMERDIWEAEDDSFRDQFIYLGEFTENENGCIGLDIKFVDVESGAGDYASSMTPTIAPGLTSDPVPEDEPTIDTVPDPKVAPDETPDSEIIPDDLPTDNGPSPIPGTTKEPTLTPVSVNDIPKTGDMMDCFILIAIASAILLVVTCFGQRRDGAKN